MASTQTTGLPVRGRDYPCLHGLRGILAFWVFMSHASSGLHYVPFGKYAYVAVDLFFILSGFVLMNAHVRDFATAEGGGVSIQRVARFLSLRFWRTYPTHIAVILVCLAISVFAYGYMPPWRDLLRATILIDTWYIPVNRQDLNGVTWSLRVEWVGYFAFPWICWGLARWSRHPTVILAIPVILVTEIVALSAVDFSGWPLADSEFLVRMFGGFILGCVLWTVMDRPLARVASGDPLMILSGLLLAGMLAVTQPLYALPLSILIVLLAVRPGKLTARILAGPVCVFLGRISFPLYLVHGPVTGCIGRFQASGVFPMPGIAYTGVATIASIGAAALISILVEEPARLFGRRWTRARFPPLPGHPHAQTG